MNRYFKLLELVREVQPKHIVEIGTWNGKRATEMMAVSNAYYTGFDLFEEATDESDVEEMNVKPHEEMVEIANRIETAGFNKFQLIRAKTSSPLTSPSLMGATQKKPSSLITSISEKLSAPVG